MFKRPSTTDAGSAHYGAFSNQKKQTKNKPAIQAVKINRADYRLLDPTLTPDLSEPHSCEPSHQVLQGEELQAFLKHQKLRREKEMDSVPDSLTDFRRSNDPETAKLQDSLQADIISSAATALASLPTRERRIVIDLIHALQESCQSKEDN